VLICRQGYVEPQIMAIPLEQFVKHLEDSGILAGDTLGDYLPPRGSPKDAQDLARELVRTQEADEVSGRRGLPGEGEVADPGQLRPAGENRGPAAWGRSSRPNIAGCNRIVAVKMLPTGLMKKPDVVDSFRA